MVARRLWDISIQVQQFTEVTKVVREFRNNLKNATMFADLATFLDAVGTDGFCL